MSATTCRATITCTSAHTHKLTDDALEARYSFFVLFFLHAKFVWNTKTCFSLLFRETEETERSANNHLAATTFACTVQNPTYSPTDICHGLEESVDYEDVM